MKTDERRRARELRTAGLAVREIAEVVGISRSSASNWVRDIVLTPEQRKALDDRGERGRAVTRRVKAERARAVRLGYQEEGRRFARRRGGSYAAGCMLHWAEGDKCRNSVRISNSDPEVLVFFASFLREHFGVADAKMLVACNLFADHVDRQREIERYWLDRLGLPPSSLRKSMVNVYSKYSKKTRTNRLPYGTCKLIVHSTRIVQTIYGSIQEYGGFDRPAWLD
ncbi:MAG TPA: hypothetical protein VGH92_03370 [Gaiellaceae bacterium]|jgi:predicted transcriptional regulator